MNRTGIINSRIANPNRSRKADAFTINALIFIVGVMAGYAWAALAYGKF